MDVETDATTTDEFKPPLTIAEASKQIGDILNKCPGFRAANLVIVYETGVGKVEILPAMQVGKATTSMKLASTLGMLLQGIGHSATYLGAELDRHISNMGESAKEFAERLRSG